MVSIRRLIWDAWNVAHIARHAVTPEEVEQVCRGDPVFRDSSEGRLLAVGPTRAGRMLAVALDPEAGASGAYYPVTARPASRQERRRYQVEKGA